MSLSVATLEPFLSRVSGIRLQRLLPFEELVYALAFRRLQGSQHLVCVKYTRLRALHYDDSHAVYAFGLVERPGDEAPALHGELFRRGPVNVPLVLQDFVVEVWFRVGVREVRGRRLFPPGAADDPLVVGVNGPAAVPVHRIVRVAPDH